MGKPTTIRTDSHGLYVVIDSGVYRPQRAKGSQNEDSARRIGTTAFHEGELVIALQVYRAECVSLCGYTPVGMLNIRNIEYWDEHGRYLLPAPDEHGPSSGVSSSECAWRPVPFIEQIAEMDASATSIAKHIRARAFDLRSERDLLAAEVEQLKTRVASLSVTIRRAQHLVRVGQSHVTISAILHESDDVLDS